jgi:hypothetical protein
MGFTKKQIKGFNYQFKAECLTEIGYHLNLELDKICLLSSDKQDNLIHNYFNLSEKESQLLSLIVLNKKYGATNYEIFQAYDKIDVTEKEKEGLAKTFTKLAEILTLK